MGMPNAWLLEPPSPFWGSYLWSSGASHAANPRVLMGNLSAPRSRLVTPLDTGDATAHGSSSARTMVAAGSGCRFSSVQAIRPVSAGSAARRTHLPTLPTTSASPTVQLRPGAGTMGAAEAAGHAPEVLSVNTIHVCIRIPIGSWSAHIYVVRLSADWSKTAIVASAWETIFA